MGKRADDRRRLVEGCSETGWGGLRSGSVKSNCKKLLENCGNLRCRNQTSQSLKEQQFCTGDTQTH